MVEGRRIRLPQGVTIPRPGSGKGKKQAESSVRNAPNTPEEGEIKETEKPEAQDENVGHIQDPTVEVHDIETSSSPSKGKKKPKYKMRKEKVGGTSKITLVPVEKEASSSHLESPLKGPSNLTLPDDLLNYGFDDPEALKFHSPARGDTGVQAPVQGDNTPISKDKGTGPSGGTLGHTRTHALHPTLQFFAITPILPNSSLFL